MATNENTIFGQQYGRNIMQLAQQETSKLYSSIYVKPNVEGKNFYQDQIGEWSMALKAGRNSATPANDPNLHRRQGIMLDYNDGHLLDKEDDLKILSDPKSAFTIAGGYSIGRQIDDVIIAKFGASAFTGEEGGTTTVLPSSQVVTADSTGLTKAKLLAAKRILDLNDVPKSDRYFVTSPYGMEDLLNTTEVTSSDFNTVKALVEGDFDTWLGFKFIESTRLLSESTTELNYAYHKTGMCLGIAANPNIRTDERSDLSYAWQIYYSLHMGATRLEEDKVVEVEIIIPS
jgi:hypothetical protein